MASVLLQQLTELEDKWKKGPEWRSKLDRWESWNAQARQRQREAEKASKVKRRDLAEDSLKETPWQEAFDPADPLPQFSFAAKTGPYSQVDLTNDLERMHWANIPNWAKECLRRGIAVHHAGMNKQYRTLVERYARFELI